MPESLSSPQMLGNAPAHNVLSSISSSPTMELFRHLLQQHQQLQQQAAALQIQQQQQQKEDSSSSEATTTAATTTATINRSSTSSPESHIKPESITTPEATEEVVDEAPESVESSSPHSPPPPSTSRSSSRGNNNTGSSSNNNPNSIRPQRKLKIYGVEEKLDIIDYAKIIGNRAAGREYNVAESSIREWRKNEVKLRTSAENARATQSPNPEKDAFYEKLYGGLVTYINSEGDGITWKMVRDKCKELWDKWGKEKFPEGQVSMHLQGWVARFLQKAREAKDIPEVPPPISSTNNSTTSSSSTSTSLMNGITMVPSTSAVDLSPSSSQPPPTKRSRISNNSNETAAISKDSSSTSSPSTTKASKTAANTVVAVTPEMPKSRRKNIAPKRVLDATVKTSTTTATTTMPLDLSNPRKSIETSTNNGLSTKKLLSDVENDEDSAIKNNIVSRQ